MSWSVVACAADVGGAQLAQRGDGRRLDRAGDLGPLERVLEHEGHGQDRPGRVRDALAGDVGRRAVDRLVEARRRRPARPTAGRRSSRRGRPTRRSGCRRTCCRSGSRRTRAGRAGSRSWPRPRSGARASTSGYSAATSVTTRRHRREAASTFALSTEVTCFLRRRASLKATWATRRTSSARLAPGVERLLRPSPSAARRSRRRPTARARRGCRRGAPGSP